MAWGVRAAVGVGARAAVDMAVTGSAMWFLRRSKRPRLTANAATDAADTIILVGSQGGATWAFAATLHDALTAAGLRVHTGPLNAIRSAYPRARRLFILTSTYGDGGAPASADRFFKRLPSLGPMALPPFAVLGFGDSAFPDFCGFAGAVDQALRAQGLRVLHELATID
eukprot:gene48298-65520_t